MRLFGFATHADGKVGRHAPRKVAACIDGISITAKEEIDRGARVHTHFSEPLNQMQIQISIQK
jgi:hypothetical protein